jgi:2-polyprenyl-3-methyl-5-hydroxy-6-metoxy-1,4-benzoquinol methylase
VSKQWQDQEPVAHRLPKAELVDRVEYLCQLARGKRVIHVGFADVGFREMQERADRWLHAHLADAAKELVGIDVDEEGVGYARSHGWEAYAADCTDPVELRALGLEPAELVIAGEVIEHLPNPGDLLRALHELVAPGGTLVITTPNAAGWLNPMASLAGYEVNHPDHIVMFTWSPLTTLMARQGWEVVTTRTYCPNVKDLAGHGLRFQMLALGARFAIWLQRTVARLFAPFVADGLIVVARRGT